MNSIPVARQLSGSTGLTQHLRAPRLGYFRKPLEGDILQFLSNVPSDAHSGHDQPALNLGNFIQHLAKLEGLEAVIRNCPDLLNQRVMLDKLEQPKRHPGCASDITAAGLTYREPPFGSGRESIAPVWGSGGQGAR